MAVDVRINGSTVDVAPDGVTRNRIIPTTYSVDEESTPIDPSDTSGAFGSFQFGVIATSTTQFAGDKTAQIEDDFLGTTEGTITILGDANIGEVATITADSRLGQLYVDRTIAPFTGRFEDALLYYFGLANLTTGIIIDDSLKPLQVTFQGYVGKVWDFLKEVCTAKKVEISLVSDNIVVRKLRGRIAEDYRDASVSRGLDYTQRAQSVIVHYYGNEYRTNSLVYPPGGWTPDVDVLDLNAGETKEWDLEIDDTTLVSIQQPTCVDYVDRNYAASSVYSVSGNDGRPITAAQWIGQGGSLTLSVNDDLKSIHVKVIAPQQADYAPYTIGVTAGSSNYYSSLRILGTGVFVNDQSITIKTGQTADASTQEVGAEIQNRSISTLTEALDAAVWTVGRYIGPLDTIQVTTRGINRVGESGSTRFRTIADFNAEWAGKLISQFNAPWVGHPIVDFNNAEYAKVADDFVNQAFGNVAGARRRYKDQYYRIRTATITPDDVQYTGERDTIIADHNNVWAGKTIADYNNEWWFFTLHDYAVAPLKKAS